MWTIREMKEKGKAAFKGNYWPCVLAAFLMSLFAGSRVATSNSQTQNPDLQNQFGSMTPEQQRAVIAVVLGGLAVALLIPLSATAGNGVARHPTSGQYSFADTIESIEQTMLHQ